MFSHVMLGCSDRERAHKFYNATMGALGVGEPIDGQPCSHGNGSTIGFAAPSPEAVDAWHAAGLANGGTAIEDPPGIREGSFGKLYLAYLRDPDGNKLCGFYRIPDGQ